MSTAEEVGRTGDDFHKHPCGDVLMLLGPDVQFKAVGNKALQAGDFDGAIEAYTKVGWLAHGTADPLRTWT